MDYFGGLLSKIDTDKEDITLPEGTEQYESHVIDCVNKNIFDSQEALFHIDSHAIEIVNQGSSVCCDEFNDVPAGALPVVKDEFEVCVDKAEDCSDVIVDCDNEPDVVEKRVLIDSVFFACDPTNTGSVAVSDVINYLRDTLHVSNCLYIYSGRKSTY